MCGTEGRPVGDGEQDAARIGEKAKPYRAIQTMLGIFIFIRGAMEAIRFAFWKAHSSC